MSDLIVGKSKINGLGHNIFKVNGHSMQKDNIFAGDYIVIDRKQRIKNRDIVVVLLPKFVSPNKRLVVKRFKRKNNHSYFYSLSKISLRGIIDDAKIIGKVIAILCKGKHIHEI